MWVIRAHCPLVVGKSSLKQKHSLIETANSPIGKSKIVSRMKGPWMIRTQNSLMLGERTLGQCNCFVGYVGPIIG